jgi:hypothetical protein
MERHETVAGAIALLAEAVTLERADVAIANERDGRPVSIKQLHQISGTELIGQRVYQSRTRRRVDLPRHADAMGLANGRATGAEPAIEGKMPGRIF